MEDKDVSVEVRDDLLILHGDKRAEREGKDERATTLPSAATAASCAASACRLPPDADAGRAHVSFTRGVLTVTVPKTAEAHARVKKIDVKSF